MSGIPGYTVTIGERPAASVEAAATSNGFMAGFAERGSVTEPILILSPADAANKLGARLTTEPLLYDAIDAFFREGGSVLYVSRINPGAAVAAKEVVDSESKKVLKFVAISPGSWGNALKIAITTEGGKTTVVVKYEGLVVETSPALETRAEIIAWAAGSQYVRAEAEAESTKVPKTQEVTLAGGSYTPGSATDEQKIAAINRFDKDLGPGQIAAPGLVSEAVQKALLTHAAESNRRAILDSPKSTASANEIAEAATKLRGTTARFGAMVAPWAVIPGTAIGTTRTVPYSPIYMGQIARAEAAGFTPNQAAAGTKRGQTRYATDLTAAFTAAELKLLNESGVIVSKKVRGIPTTFGIRSLVNATTDPNWVSFPASRLVMGVAALAGQVLEQFEFEQIDGHGYIFKDLQGELSNVACMPYYGANSLYGQTPAEAFRVETGPDVNTEQSIAAGEVKAQIAIRVSPNGEELSVEIVKVPITEEI